MPFSGDHGEPVVVGSERRVLRRRLSAHPQTFVEICQQPQAISGSRGGRKDAAADRKLSGVPSAA